MLNLIRLALVLYRARARIIAPEGSYAARVHRIRTSPGRLTITLTLSVPRPQAIKEVAAIAPQGVA